MKIQHIQIGKPKFEIGKLKNEAPLFENWEDLLKFYSCKENLNIRARVSNKLAHNIIKGEKKIMYGSVQHILQLKHIGLGLHEVKLFKYE
jgi:hypothetical protein